MMVEDWPSLLRVLYLAKVKRSQQVKVLSKQKGQQMNFTATFNKKCLLCYK